MQRLGVDYIDILHCHDIEFCPDMRQVRCGVTLTRLLGSDGNSHWGPTELASAVMMPDASFACNLLALACTASGTSAHTTFTHWICVGQRSSPVGLHTLSAV
eukprot:GHUV01037686.1.p3 GENE.GHUV01037686.1~~GHUV01037686.1.p3  ORF type:complete len:102 (+),score=17.02 GHUV01037686.1:501-806(+)